VRNKVAFGGGQAFENAWPELLDPRDRRAGDELLPAPGSYENHRDFRSGPLLSPERWAELDAQFVRLFPLVLAGRAPASELEQLAGQMGLCSAMRHDGRRCDVVDPFVSDGLLADIAGNYLPEVGPIAADRVLGPFADLVLPRELRSTAVGLLATIRLVAPAERPIERFCEDKPRPPIPLRAAVRAAFLAPPMLYAVEDGLRPMFSLAPGFRIPAPPRLPDAPAVLGRLVPTRAGSAFILGIALPILPDLAPITRRLTWELWSVRRHELRLTWEDLLRERAEVLYRSVLEQVWERWLAPGGGAWPTLNNPT
jgi:hypothetical protein